MIEINLARQLEALPIEKESSVRSYGWVGVVLCIGIGLASWWWTQIHQQEFENLLQEKHIQTQSLDKIQTTLSRLAQYEEEKRILNDALDVMQGSRVGATQPIALLNGVSESIDGLEIWLDRVQMVDQVVELRGQSFALKDIGQYVDALENDQIITSLPVVEILDHENRESGRVFSFMIRFTIGATGEHMIHWWNETPILQRFIILGLVVVLFVLGMQSWVWSSLDRSIIMLRDDIAGLDKKNRESIQSMASLKDVEREVALLREKLPLTFQQVPVSAEPQAFRREVVNIGKRTGVFVRLWKPQKKIIDSEQQGVSLDIVVRVEGSFYSTVQFLDELLQLSWVKTLNPLILVRKQNVSNASVVTTDLTIKGWESHRRSLTKEMMKT